MTTTMLVSPFGRLFQEPLNGIVGGMSRNVKVHGPLLQINHCSARRFTCSGSQFCCGLLGTGNRLLLEPISAVGSGLETSITDQKDNVISIKNVEIVVESKDDDKMQVRVDVPGKETEIVFEKVLRNLARAAPPVPGFRREKGGKTSKVPRDFLLQILGEERVTNFVLQEIVSTTVADYVKKENLTVKDNKISTTQTAEELKSVFVPGKDFGTPGKDFGFSATLELEKSEEETA